MPTTVIEQQAQHLEVRTDESFLEFADRVHRKNMRPLCYENGSLIELDPELEYSFLMLGMKRLLTQEEFVIVYAAFMSEIKRLEDSGALPKDLVRTVATPFDIPRSARPVIPSKFADEIEDDAVIKMYLTGNTSFTLGKILPDAKPVEDDLVETVLTELENDVVQPLTKK